jgi:hypothetical protein
MNDGSLVATWQAGSGEKHNDSSIWTSTKSSPDSAWSYPKIAVTLNGTCIMNAILYRNTSDILHLTGHYGGGVDGQCLINSWKTLTFHRDPVTLEWYNEGPPSPIWAMGAVKNQCVRLTDRWSTQQSDSTNGHQGTNMEMVDRVLCPSSYESPDRDTSHFESTTGDMRTFVLHNNVTAPLESPCNDMIQPLIFLPVDPSKGVFALFRSDCEVAAQAWSLDPYGTQWPPAAEKSSLLNPNSGIGGTTMVLTVTTLRPCCHFTIHTLPFSGSFVVDSCVQQRNESADSTHTCAVCG